MLPIRFSKSQFAKFAPHKTWLFIIFLAFLIRLPFFVFPHLSYDLESYYLVAKIVRQGKIVYQETSRYNYLPLWFWIIHFLDLISLKFKISLALLIKTFLFLIDLTLALILYIFEKQKQKTHFPSISIIYLFNPLTILISSYYAQFDNLMLLTFLTACYFLFIKNYQQPWAGLLTGLSISIKPIPLIFLPLFWQLRSQFKNKLTLILSIIAIPLSLLLPYLIQSPIGIWQHLILYSGIPHWWGYSLIISSLQYLFPAASLLAQINLISQKFNSFVVILGVGLIYYFLVYLPSAKSKLSLEKSFSILTIICLSFYSLTGGFGLQWLLWVIPFALITRDHFVFPYLALASLHLIIAFIHEMVFFKYFNWGNSVSWNIALRGSSLILWLFILYWLYNKIGQWQKNE